MPKRTTKRPEVIELPPPESAALSQAKPTPEGKLSVAEGMANAGLLDDADAKAIVAAINAPPDDPGGHRAAAIAKTMTITPHEPMLFEFATCPICGGRQTVEVCPVDGFRFKGDDR